MADVTRISMWSGPRNISTALMYAFRERRDTTVFDEPLYGHYLAASGTPHPMRDETIAVMPTNRFTAVGQLYADVATPVAFFKNMAHHTYGIDLDEFAGLRNAILTRDPHAMLVSLRRGFPDAELAHTGLPQSVAILEWMLASGEQPVVLDAGEILKNPDGVLSAWCKRVGIPFDSAMLSWPAGPKPEDGVWADHWYDQVHQSTGFGPYRKPPQALPDELGPLLAACLPLYERLMEYAIVA